MGVLSLQSSPILFVLPAGARFLLGEWMTDGDTSFVHLDGGSVTLAGAGSGATLDAQRCGRIFYMTAGNLTLTNLQLVNGSAQACHV